MRNSSIFVVLTVALLLGACRPAPAAVPTLPPEPALLSPSALPPTPTVILPTASPVPTAAPAATAIASALAPLAVATNEGPEPFKIQSGDVTFYVKADVFVNQLGFSVRGVYPVAYEKAAPGGLPPFIKSVDFQIQDKQVKLDPVGGGGGGGGEEEGMTEQTNGVAYKITPNLVKGEKVHLTARVTFDEVYGIKGTMPFEFDLVVQDEMK